MEESKQDVLRVLRKVDGGEGISQKDNQTIRNLVKDKLIRSTLNDTIDPETGEETPGDFGLTLRGKACLKMHTPT
jgi:hypothetical protein